MDKLFLVMPAYNEAANIARTVEQWVPVLQRFGGEGSRLVIADSQSTDETHAILENLQQQVPALEVLSDTGKQHGPKLMALYRYALEQGADYIFQTDSDGQTDPNEFERFWQCRQEYEAVIGCRGQRGDGAARAFVEKVVCLLLQLYFGVKVPDANAPFRLMQANVLKKHLCRLPEDYDLPNIMLTAFFVYGGHSVRFEPITFRPRGGGKGSINVRRIIQIGWKAMGNFAAFRRQMKQQ